MVTSLGEKKADVGIDNGIIVAIESAASGRASEEIDATGLHIFPGIIDAHVHFNEPGRAEWEGFETGSRAFAAGGGTLFFDMPLNAHPPTLDGGSFDLKLAAAKTNSLTDFAFWGGLVPRNLDSLAELAGRGVIGFKAFMADSGMEDFSRADDRTLREGMKRAAKLKLPVAVHAESETMTRRLAQERISKNLISARDYLESRPVEAELEAIDRAIELACETGCALHIVHVSSAAGVDRVSAAAGKGVDVTCETCPHYLALTEDDMEKLGAVAKCAPPLRSAGEREKLWERLAAGKITTVGSDHSPSPGGMKTGDNFFKIWGGISSIQHTLSILLSAGEGRPQVSPALWARLLSSNVRERFKLKQKGRIDIGFDADLALVNLGLDFGVKREELLYRHQQTPYLGRTLRGVVQQTLLRGRTVFKDGKIVSKPLGQLVRPNA